MGKFEEFVLRLISVAMCTHATTSIFVALSRGYISDFKGDSLIHFSSEPTAFFFQLFARLCGIAVFGFFLITSFFDKRLSDWILARQSQKKS
jgi:hypothetical protein